MPEEVAAEYRHCRERGGRVWAVGTTVVRTLESVAAGRERIRAGRGTTDLFISPPFDFRAVDCLVTNFHLPRSTLLMLVAAFAGTEPVLDAYHEAVRKGYRFYSYGDAMAVLPVTGAAGGAPFALQAVEGRARAGRLVLPGGAVDTPVFMPVGTLGTVKGISPEELEQAGASMVLANTYHLYLRPGAEVVGELGGLHDFMRWKGPILTDSGGFQVFSLAAIREIDDDGGDLPQPHRRQQPSLHPRGRDRHPAPSGGGCDHGL